MTSRTQTTSTSGRTARAALILVALLASNVVHAAPIIVEPQQQNVSPPAPPPKNDVVVAPVHHPEFDATTSAGASAADVVDGGEAGATTAAVQAMGGPEHEHDDGRQGRGERSVERDREGRPYYVGTSTFFGGGGAGGTRVSTTAAATGAGVPNAQQLAQQLFSPETAAFVRGAAEIGAAAYDMMTGTTIALIDELRWMSDNDDGALFGTTFSETDAAASAGVTSQASIFNSNPPRPPPPPPSPPPPSNPPPVYDFRSSGRWKVTSYEVSFYWPGVGLDFASMTLPWITATVFKPEVAETSGVHTTTKTPKFPVIAFGIGWNSWTERYSRTLTMLASHGFIVIAPSVADRVVLPTSFSALAGNLRACLEWAAVEGRRQGHHDIT